MSSSRSSRSTTSLGSPTPSPTPRWQTPLDTRHSSPDTICEPCSPGNVRRIITVDWPLVVPIDQDTGFLAPFTQAMAIPHQIESNSNKHASSGTVTWSSIPGNDYEGTSVSKSPLLSEGFVRIAVSVDYPCRMEVRVFSVSERAKPIIKRYVESIDGLEVRIAYAEIFPLINETFSPLELLFSLTIIWSPESSSKTHGPQVSETASPATIEVLGGFLDQPGGHDIVFCFPKGQQLYADRYVLQRSSSYFRSLFSASDRDRERGVKQGTSTGKPAALAEDSDDEDWEEKLRSRHVIHPLTSAASTAIGDETDLEDVPTDTDVETAQRRGSISSNRTTMSLNQVKVPPAQVLPPQMNRSKSLLYHKNGALDPVDAKLEAQPEEKKAAPKYDESVFVMWINETSYRTFRAMLYFIYTGFITFAPLTSSFRPSPPSILNGSASMPPLNPHRRLTSITELSSISQQRHIAREVVVNDYTSRFPNRPTPVSPKSIYAVAKKYDLPALEAHAMSRIHSAMTPSLAITELFSAFSRTYEPVRMAQLAHVIASWNEVVRSPEWESTKERGKARPDVYFTQMLCEILERLPSGSSRR